MPLKGTFPLLWRFHNTCVFRRGRRHWWTRHLYFSSQDLRSIRKVETNLWRRSRFPSRIKRQPPAECIKINKSIIIIITFVHPEVSVSWHASPQHILGQPIKSFGVVFRNGSSNSTYFCSKLLYWILTLLQEWKTIIVIQVIKIWNTR